MNLFDVVAKLTLDSSAYEKGISGAVSTAKSIGGKIGGAISTISKVSVAALGTASTAVSAITKQAVDAYGNYEQLAGGVETLFGDSAKKVLADAQNAYKTAGMSANEYMETSIQSAASLINALGGDQAKAAELMNMSITDMSDNVNKMGTTMEAVQNAYRGFSRGNFTMLDNLALGFAGTKEGMQQLLDKAHEISGIKYDISSYADIVKAIHVVQDEMGITGTTAKEAATTIQGSVSSMKSAWQNLLVGLVQDGADFDKLIDNVIDSLLGVENQGKRTGGVINNILPRIKKSLSGIGTLVKKLAPIITKELPGLVKSVLPDLIKSAESLLSGVSSALPELFRVVTDNIPQALLSIGKAIVDNLPAVGDMLIQGLESVLDLIDKIDFKNAGKIAGQLLAKLAIAIGEHASDIISAVPDIIFALIDGFLDPTNQDDYKKGATSLIGGITDGLIITADKMANAAIPLMQSLFDAMIDKLPYFLGYFVGALGKLLKSVFEGPTGSLLGLFGSILNGDANAAQSYLKKLGADFSSPDFVGAVLDFGVGMKLGAGEVLDDYDERVDASTKHTKDKSKEASKAVNNDFLKIKDGHVELTGTIDENNLTATTNFISEWGSTPGEMGGIWSMIAAAFNITDAETWGSDMVQNFISGINSKIAELRTVVTSTADILKSFWGHSVPKEGPLSNDDKWGAHMMDNIINGIDSKRGELERMVANVADSMDFRSAMTVTPEINAGVNSTESRIDLIAAKIDALTNAILNQHWELDGDVVATRVDERLGATATLKARE